MYAMVSIRSLLLTTVFLAAILPFTAFAADTSTATELNRTLPSLFIAGDSTAAKYDGPDQQGWAEPFADYFDLTKINVVNRARGGRSSRTFITEGLWDQLVTDVKAGDFVLIQFGHNDAGALNEEPPGSTRPLRARGTIPTLGEESQEIDNVITKQHEVVHTFGWYLRKMVADVRAKGATPFILSTTVRNEWQDRKVERGPGPYQQLNRQVAVAERVEFIDATAFIAEHYERIGPARVAAFFPKDRTHTNAAGADANAACVVTGLKRATSADFSQYFAAKGRGVRQEP
jgi:lysophospholipase L1-like esterase